MCLNQYLNIREAVWKWVIWMWHKPEFILAYFSTVPEICIAYNIFGTFVLTEAENAHRTNYLNLHLWKAITVAEIIPKQQCPQTCLYAFFSGTLFFWDGFCNRICPRVQWFQKNTGEWFSLLHFCLHRNKIFFLKNIIKPQIMTPTKYDWIQF